MPLRRTRRIGGKVARTALVAGTATAASHKVSDAMQRSAHQRAASPDMPNVSDEDIVLLGKLMKLHNSGSLTDREYETLKVKVLAA